MVLLGYFFISGDLEIPGSIIAFFLICLTAVINFIDIKDYEGDKKAGIKTIPVIFGLKISKVIIGVFFLISYFFVYFILKKFLIPLIILSIIHFYLINRKNYNEKLVFIAYLVSLIILIVYLLI